MKSGGTSCVELKPAQSYFTVLSLQNFLLVGGWWVIAMLSRCQPNYLLYLFTTFNRYFKRTVSKFQECNLCLCPKFLKVKLIKHEPKARVVLQDANDKLVILILSYSRALFENIFHFFVK